MTAARPARAFQESEPGALEAPIHLQSTGRDGFERRQVTVARRGQTQVAIAKGLEEGERVALENPEKAQ